MIESIEDDCRNRGPADTTILLLGDLVDRGPDSKGVVDRAMRWDESFAQLGCILGNHEASLLSVLSGETKWLGSWLGYGGRETLLSYGVAPETVSADEDEIVEATRDSVPDDHREWLESLPLFERRGDYVFAHAGIRPGVPIDEQEARDLLWIRGEFLESRADHGAVIVHGHSITSDVDERANRIGIDTGAYFSDKLTALGLESGDRWFLQT